MKIKVFRFLASNVAYRAYDSTKQKDWYPKRLSELDTSCEIEEKINAFISDVDVVDIKVNTIDVNYHNNGGHNTIEVIYTILYRELSQ